MTKTIERTGIQVPTGLLPEIDHLTRRGFLVGVGSLPVLASCGCGGGG